MVTVATRPNAIGCETVRYRVLGSIEVADESGPIPIGRGKPRTLLAALLIDANRELSVDELIERIWDGQPPATATKSVQVLISQLRKALGGEMAPIATVGGGYILRVQDGETDVDLFEDLLERGRGQLGEGRAREAEATFDQALNLWRGRPFQDVAYEDFAREAIARLEDRRVVAMEERFEAMLAGGRHVDAVAGLERLVADHPLRERALGLLMLALYRSGRRADALAVYDTARRRLSEELGIDPGEPLRRLHEAILDSTGPDMDAEDGIGLEAPRGPRPRWLIAAAGVAILATAAAVVVATRGSGSARIAGLHGDSVGLVEPGTGHIVGQYNVGGAPSQVVADTHVAWTLNAADRIVARVDLVKGSVRRIGPAATPTGLALGDGSLWVSYATPGKTSGTYTIGVLRLDPTSLQQRARIQLAARTRWAGGTLPVLATPQGVWVGAFDGVYRINPTTDRSDLRVPVSDPRFGGATVLALAELHGAIWALTDTRSIVQIDAGQRKARVLTRLNAPSYGTMVAGGGSLWVSDPFGRVWRLDPGPEPGPHDIITGVDVSSLAFGDGAAWVTSEVTGTLTRIDPVSEQLRTVAVGGAPTAVSVSPAGVLVATARDSGGVNADSCGSVSSGGRPVSRVIAADLDRNPGYAPYTEPMVRAMEFELQAHHFRAGRFRVGLQVCDNSTPQSFVADAATCTANAKAYAASSRVIAVLGPDQSSCAFREIPILDVHGPVPMAAPTPNEPGLTLARSGSFVYPGGVRNFVRVSSRYDQWGVAAARLAKRLGVQRVYVYQRDRQGFYDAIMAPAFAAEARRLGIHVVGPDSPTGGFQRLAGRLAAAGVDGVFDAADTVDAGFLNAMRSRPWIVGRADRTGCLPSLPRTDARSAAG